MNERECFQAIMHFEKPDRVPIYSLEGIAEQTVRQWCMDETFPTGMSTDDYFEFDSGPPFTIDGIPELISPILDPIPHFLPLTLADDEEWKTIVNKWGFKERYLKSNGVGPRIYVYIDGPIKNRGDWRNVKKRYDPHDPRRKPKLWGEELFNHCQNTDRPVVLYLEWGPGRAIKNGYMMGLVPFLENLYEKPDLIQDMFQFWADFLIVQLQEVVQKVKIDYAWIEDDGLGHKTSSLVSPKMYRQFYSPHIRKVTDFLRGSGIDIIGYYGSGNIEPLIPVMLEAGYNLFAPLERAAGMDAVKLRKQYGKKILMMGSIGRAALMKDKAAIEKEVLSRVPGLVAQGGYIPALDDMVLPDISLENYLYFIDLVKSVCNA